MKNQTRTDLLNYLNDNKIEYTFDIITEQITVDLTVTEEDDEYAEEEAYIQAWRSSLTVEQLNQI